MGMGATGLEVAIVLVVDVVVPLVVIVRKL